MSTAVGDFGYRVPRLSALQKRFVQEFIRDGNPAEAAVRAGYPRARALESAMRLLDEPDVAASIETLSAKGAIGADVTFRKIVEHAAAAAFSNMGDYYSINANGDPYIDIRDLSAEQSYAIRELTIEHYSEGRGIDAREMTRTKVKLADPTRALKLLADLFALQPPKQVQVSLDAARTVDPEEATRTYLDFVKNAAFPESDGQ